MSRLQMKPRSPVSVELCRLVGFVRQEFSTANTLFPLLLKVNCIIYSAKLQDLQSMCLHSMQNKTTAAAVTKRRKINTEQCACPVPIK